MVPESGSGSNDSMPLSPTMEHESLEHHEEDTELRDLVTHLLQSQGVLGTIKAQLRSNVYLALEGGSDGKDISQKSSEVNTALRDYAKSTDGRLLLHLIRDFLVFFNLNFSLSIFEPEAVEACGLATRSRGQLMEGLGLSELTNPKLPLLAEVLRLSKVSILKSETPTPSERTEDESSISSSLESGHTQKSSTFRDKSIPEVSQSHSNASTPFSSLNLSRGGGIENIGKIPSTEHQSSSHPRAKEDLETSASRVASGSSSLLKMSKSKFSLESTSPKTSFKMTKESSASSSDSLSNPSSMETGMRRLAMDAEPVTMMSKEADLAKPAKIDSMPKPSTSSSLADLPKLGAGQTTLGNLPPLTGSPGNLGGARKTLAPLKNIPTLAEDSGQSGKLGQISKVAAKTT
eukprot:maker-scaffold567_size135338-snap-gene-0.20 protein:Tk01947 transcript:maker-scaffold567_size135338-snap-gene-0.20-mRNA-1 annotation:"fgfr1 oncogene partner"